MTPLRMVLSLFPGSECKWYVMENVPDAAQSPFIGLLPQGHMVVLRDWDCGGETSRKRAFWTAPHRVMAPERREGQPSLSVMSTTYKRGRSTSQYCKDKGFLPGDLPLSHYGKLQGCEDIVAGLEKYGFSRRNIIQLIGNGVPYAMGRYVAEATKRLVV